MSEASTESTPLTPREIWSRVRAALLKGDMSEYAALWREDGVLDLPFGPPNGAQKIIKGRDEIRELMTKGLAAVGFRMREMHDEVYLTDDPEVLIADYEAPGVVESTGYPYNTRYLDIMRVRDGKIVYYRHFALPAHLILAQSTRMGEQQADG